MRTSMHSPTLDGAMRETSLPCPDGCGRSLIECRILGMWVTMPCSCRVALGEHHEQASRNDRSKGRAYDSGIPESMKGVQPVDRNAMLGSGSWIWITGNDSTMKACAILKGWLDSGKSGLFVTETGLTSSRSMFDCGLLVIDGFGFHHPERWEAARLREVIEHRNNRNMPVVVSSVFDRSKAAGNVCSDWDDARRAVEILGRRCVNG